MRCARPFIRAAFSPRNGGFTTYIHFGCTSEIPRARGPFISFILPLLALLIQSNTLVAATWYVHPGGAGDATTVQAGVDLSSHGDTVLVAPGTYADTTTMLVDGVYRTVTLHLTKDIVLIAEGDTSNTTIGGPDSDVAIFAEGVGPTGRIEGLRIETAFIPYGCAARSADAMTEPPTRHAGEQIGLYAKDCSLIVDSCLFMNNGHCAELYNSPVSIVGTVLSWALFGIFCEAGSDATISNCRAFLMASPISVIACNPAITDNHFGGIGQMCTAVSVYSGGAPYIARNYFDHIRPTAIIIGSSEPIIEDNYFAEGLTAIFMSVGTEVPIIRNNIFYDHGSWVISITSGAPVLEGNTFDLNDNTVGSIAIAVQGVVKPPVIHRNLFTRFEYGIVCFGNATTTTECNNFFAVPNPYFENCPDQTGINGNISVDPQFCGTWDSGNWFLQSDSPCAPGNHPDGYNCGQIGARGVGCQATPVRTLTWGAIKQGFAPKTKETP